MTDVANFLAAQRYTRDEVFAESCPIPSKPGVYGFWFRSVPAGLDARGCKQQDGLTLLYVGISPTRPPTEGKPPSTQDLRKRIRYHYGGGNADADGSALRKTLGVVLAGELDLELRRVGSGRRRTLAGGEAVLTRWMADNVLVSWVARRAPWHVEAELLSALDVPLVLHGNKHNAFYPELNRLRRAAMKRADRLRVLAEWS